MGVFGCPSTITNVEIVAVAPTVPFFAEVPLRFASFGYENSRGTKLFGNSSHVENPKVLEESMSIPLQELKSIRNKQQKLQLQVISFLLRNQRIQEHIDVYRCIFIHFSATKTDRHGRLKLFVPQSPGFFSTASTIYADCKTGIEEQLLRAPYLSIHGSV